MTYSAEISRSNPTCFMFLIDRSGSMGDSVPAQEGRTKADAVAAAINRLLQNLVIRCAKEEGIRDYFSVGVVGYGDHVGPAFLGPLAGRDLVSISEVGNSPARVDVVAKKTDDGAGGIIDQQIKMPIWFDHIASGGTPMCQALELAKTTLQNWIAQHPTSFPPVVIHITDGESTDGDPSGALQSLKALSTQDGNLLVFNVHISSETGTTPLAFPESANQLSSKYSQILFNGSSILTPFMRSVANHQHGLNLSDGARGFVLNGDMVLVIQALDIGTRPSNLR